MAHARALLQDIEHALERDPEGSDALSRLKESRDLLRTSLDDCEQLIERPSGT